MHRSSKRLTLNRETLQTLEPGALREAMGNAVSQVCVPTNNLTCPTVLCPTRRLC